MFVNKKIFILVFVCLGKVFLINFFYVLGGFRLFGCLLCIIWKFFLGKFGIKGRL